MYPARFLPCSSSQTPPPSCAIGLGIVIAFFRDSLADEMDLLKW